MSALTRRRILPRPHRRIRFPHVGPRVLAGLLILAVILVGLFFWVRQSSLVAVRRVTITGISGPDASQIRTALAQAALGMSTIDVDARRLHDAVAPFPVVHALTLSSHFPHGLRIAVEEKIPVATLLAGGQQVTVAADGTLLSGRSTTTLPTITLAALPTAGRLTGAVREDLQLLTAAPYALIARIASVAVTPERGLSLTLRSGPMIVFGTGAELADKWRSAIAVLASTGSAGASYIDVTSPSRPAAGTGSDVSGHSAAAGAATTSAPAQALTGG